jgi:hypothetical protein
MDNRNDKMICDRCGKEVYRRHIHFKNIFKFNTDSKDDFINSVSIMKSVSLEVSESWANHGLYELCKEGQRMCPHCGEKLKTWKAKLCLKCGNTFQPWEFIGDDT